MLLGHEIETALRKWERYLHSIHVTDEFVASERYVCTCVCLWEWRRPAYLQPSVASVASVVHYLLLFTPGCGCVALPFPLRLGAQHDLQPGPQGAAI